MVRAVGVTNEPEAYVTTAIEEDLNAQQQQRTSKSYILTVHIWLAIGLNSVHLI